MLLGSGFGQNSHLLLHSVIREAAFLLCDNEGVLRFLRSTSSSRGGTDRDVAPCVRFLWRAVDEVWQCQDLSSYSCRSGTQVSVPKVAAVRRQPKATGHER